VSHTFDGARSGTRGALLGAVAREAPTTSLARRWPRIALRIILIVLFVWVCLDLLNATVLAALFAIVIHPIHERLTKRFPRLGRFSPHLLTLAAVILVVLPLVFVGSQAVIAANDLLGGDPQEAIQDAQSSAIAKLTELARVLHIEPASVQRAVSDLARKLGAAAAGLAGTAAKGVPGLTIDLFLFVVALFYFIRDGSTLVAWIEEVAPFRHSQTEELFTAVDETVRGAVLGTIVVAAVQGALALGALLVFGVPGAFLWGVVAAIASLIPIFGTGLVTVPAAIYLFAKGETGFAIGMLIAVVIIGFSDNVVRPWVQSSGGKMHPLVALLAIFGGLNVFGAFGIFIGPVVAAMAIWAVESYRKRKQRNIELPHGVTSGA
jgi:predicted PurR-regulated permease PerM